MNRPTTLFSLAVALLATAAIVAVTPTTQVLTEGTLPEVSLAEAAPGVEPTTVGLTGYTPLLKNVGTATGPDGAALLVLTSADGTRQLRRLPVERAPEFAGMVADGRRLVWLELTAGDDGTVEGRLWTIDSPDAEPRMITDDVGEVALFDKRDDLVVHDGEVSWVATAPGDTPATEIRTVPLAGGEVRVQKRDGAWSFAQWPWLTSVGLSRTEPIELRNLATGEAVTVPVRDGQLMTCSPAWCRAITIGGQSALTLIELQKPDGSQRFQAASGKVAAVLVDVALLDRFEIYSHSGGRLMVLDIPHKRAIELAKAGVTQVTSRGTTLCWATGDNEATTWHTLDLNAIP